MKTRFYNVVFGEVVFSFLKVITCLPKPVYSFCAFIVTKILIMTNFNPSKYFDRNVLNVLGYEAASKEYIDFKKKYIKHQVYCTVESFVGMMWPKKI